MTNLDSILKSRDITLLTKVCIVKPMVFPVVMYGYESVHKVVWVLKNWCFQTVVLERILRVPWTLRRSNQSILKEINPECSLEGLILKLKFQYFGHLLQRAHSLEKTLRLGKIEGKRRRGPQRMRWLDTITDQWTWVWVNSGRQWKTEEPGALQPMGLQSQTWLSDWTTTDNRQSRKDPAKMAGCDGSQVPLSGQFGSEQELGTQQSVLYQLYSRDILVWYIWIFLLKGKSNIWEQPF